MLKRPPTSGAFVDHEHVAVEPSNMIFPFRHLDLYFAIPGSRNHGPLKYRQVETRVAATSTHHRPHSPGTTAAV